MADANTSVTLPHPDPPAEKVFRKTLPCYVILVHGVNDLGEAYEAQEKGLCWGLAERLGRNHDLRPYEYRLPKKDRSDALEKVPDRVYYHRVEGSSSHSPVIPFYWGFREENGKILKGEKHGEWLDRDGNRLDKDGAKNGGAFVNAANCLPHLWAPGWRPPVPGTNALASRHDRTHPLLKAPHRRYQVLAALRLALLIRILRKRHPEAAINVVAHSMGCLVSLLAQVYLMDDGDRPADCIVMNNPPYSFEENAFDDLLFRDLNQTSRARIETLKKVLAAFHEKRAKAPAWKEVQNLEANPGLAGGLWVEGKKLDPGSGAPVAFAERDNRGMIHLYFSPHDRTVALFNTQGIGWQGVPDSYTAAWQHWDARSGTEATEQQTWPRLLNDLTTSGFRQRLFLRQQRGGRPFRVGLAPQHVSIREPEDPCPGWWQRLKRLNETVPVGAKRGITGEQLNPAIDFDPGPDLLPVTPIDAAIALANGATQPREDSFDDPRPEPDRPPFIIPADHWEPLRKMLNQGQPLERQIGRIHSAIEIKDAQGKPTGRLWLRYDESPDETKWRLQTSGESENSFHSSIVSNHWHSQAVTAYDLAVARPILWTEKEKKFYKYLCEVADWRIKVDKPDDPNAKPKIENKLDLLKDTGFYADENPRNKALINATATYYVDGTPPPQIDQAKTPDKLASYIHFETTGKRAPAVG